jgi:LDH2 family malate/lactate/ureidoglycolate dehydrogenase
MLERFHVPENIAIRVQHTDMFATVNDIFLKMGMSPQDAHQATDVLLYADVRGIESHGVSNMLRRYVDAFGKGEINPTPNPVIIREKGAAVTLDSDRGHGLVVGPYAMNIAIERAKEHGIGAVAVINGRHFGACAYHAELALAYDMIGLAMTTGGLQVAPVHGAEPKVGLNPLGVAIPTQDEPPFIFDAAMSSVAGNKIALARRLGVDVMPGWIAEKDGTPIMEERPVPDEYLILPTGGTREIGAHKGYSMAVMIEVLCGILGGVGGGPFRTDGASHHFLAYDVSAFSDVPAFKRRVDMYLKDLRESKPAAGHDRVMYAGLPEYEEKIEREEKGIPYHPEVIEWFHGICKELDIPWRLTASH